MARRLSLHVNLLFLQIPVRIRLEVCQIIIALYPPRHFPSLQQSYRHSFQSTRSTVITYYAYQVDGPESLVATHGSSDLGLPRSKRSHCAAIPSARLNEAITTAKQGISAIMDCGRLYRTGSCNPEVPFIEIDTRPV
jgi:hypothetical protein